MVCVEGKRGREVCSGGGNGLSVHEGDTSRNKTQQILWYWYSAKMIILQNYLFSFALQNIFHPTRRTTRQAIRVTPKAILIATPVHYRCSDALLLNQSHIYPRLYLECTYFIYWDNLLSLYNLAYFLSHYECYLGNGRLAWRKIRAELWRKKLWTAIFFRAAREYSHKFIKL